MAGFALGAYPAEQLRTTVAIYAIFQALGFAWNHVEDAGMVWGRERNGRLKKRPWWFGSWMMQPFAFGQLLHAFVFDVDCFPEVRKLRGLQWSGFATDINGLYRLTVASF